MVGNTAIHALFCPSASPGSPHSHDPLADLPGDRDPPPELHDIAAKITAHRSRRFAPRCKPSRSVIAAGCRSSSRFIATRMSGSRCTRRCVILAGVTLLPPVDYRTLIT